jgi:hypothetical protein
MNFHFFCSLQYEQTMPVSVSTRYDYNLTIMKSPKPATDTIYPQMFWKFVIFCIKLVSEWPILLPGNGQNAGFYTIYPRASGGLQRTKSNFGVI